MLEAEEPIKKAYLEAGHRDVNAAGRMVPARASPRPMYDSKMLRIKSCPFAVFVYPRSVAASSSGRSTMAVLATELAVLFSTPEEAETLLIAIGFPRQHTPRFQTALVFWSKVLQTARNGALKDGDYKIIRFASEQFPHNQAIANHLHQRTHGATQTALSARNPEPVRNSRGTSIHIEGARDQARQEIIIQNNYKSARVRPSLWKRLLGLLGSRDH